MNIAILSVTNQGKKISDILFENLKDNPLILNVSQYHKNIIATVNDIFDKYDCIISSLLLFFRNPFLYNEFGEEKINYYGKNEFNYVYNLIQNNTVKEIVIRQAHKFGKIP